MSNTSFMISTLLGCSAIVSLFTALALYRWAKYMRERQAKISQEIENLRKQFPECRTLNEAKKELINRRVGQYQKAIDDLTKDPNAIYAVQSHYYDSQTPTLEKIIDTGKQIRFLLNQQRFPDKEGEMLRMMETHRVKFIPFFTVPIEMAQQAIQNNLSEYFAQNPPPDDSCKHR